MTMTCHPEASQAMPKPIQIFTHFIPLVLILFSQILYPSVTSANENQLLKEFTQDALEKSKKVNLYFAKAVDVFVFLGESDAKTAALTAAAVAERTQRKGLVNYLKVYSIEISNYQIKNLKVINPITEVIYKDRIKSLIKEITRKDWTMLDIFRWKAVLGEVNQDYLKALNEFDPTIFEKKYPDLLKTYE